MYLKTYILIISLIALGCDQRDLRKESSKVDSYVEVVTDNVEPPSEHSSDDMIVNDELAVVFFTPKYDELNKLTKDKSTRDGLLQAVGDFAYYASIVADSLKSAMIPVYFTDKQFITFEQDPSGTIIDRSQSNSPMGLILFDGQNPPRLIPGMQTHLSLLSTISNHIQSKKSHHIPLIEYFEEVNSKFLHIYSSHSEILNQRGNKIDQAHYGKLGAYIASRANRYHMSVYAYQRFSLQDSMHAIICRVPSRYDESAIKLYIWDQQVNMVVDEIELAENVWNERWIMVKDSWITVQSEKGIFSVVQRKKEARMENGDRTEIDSLYHWQWTGSEFQGIPTEGLSLDDFPLKDWESYQEPIAPTEITIVDENYVWLPLATGDLTWENMILELPKPYTIEKEPIENQLVANQIDTLVTISRPHIKLKFYRSPEDNLIIDGVLSDSSINFKKNLQVGMAKGDFVKVFDQLSTRDQVPDLVKVRSRNFDRVLSYTFQNDTLARIEVMNFIH